MTWARVLIRVALAIVTWVLAGFFWPCWKRGRYLRQLVHDKEFLDNVLSPEFFKDPPMDVLEYTDRHPAGYEYNLLMLIESDRRSYRRTKLLFGVPLAAILVASVTLGWPYALVNGAVCALVGSFPLGESGKANAQIQVLSMAIVLHLWREENQAACDGWVGEVSSLGDLYERVRTAAREQDGGRPATSLPTPGDG